MFLEHFDSNVDCQHEILGCYFTYDVKKALEFCKTDTAIIPGDFTKFI